MPNENEAQGTSELLWSGSAPGWEDVPDNETVLNRDTERNAQGLNRAISRVSRPTITTCLPDRGLATGAAIVILPGGGFVHLAIDKEGYDVAAWLNSIGVAGIVLKYRTDAREADAAIATAARAARGGAPVPDADAQALRAARAKVIAAATQDTLRAIRVTRSRAREWSVDPDKVGAIGFSAGGFLASAAATHWDRGRPDAADPIERASSRPDFVGLLYSGAREEVAAQITEETPPAFLAHAGDDFIPVESSIRFYTGLREAGVPAEMHLYASGGHGFGLGIHGGPVASWPERFAEWLEDTVGGA
jgi:acetyl esterase/lipase